MLYSKQKGEREPWTPGYEQTNGLLNPLHASLLGKYLQTRDPEAWEALRASLLITPWRARINAAQAEELRNSAMVRFLTDNMGTGADYAQHMAAAGDPVQLALTLLPVGRVTGAVVGGIKNGAGRVAAETGLNAAMGAGLGMVGTAVENPHATWQDYKEGAKHGVISALGMQAVGMALHKGVEVVSREAGVAAKRLRERVEKELKEKIDKREDASPKDPETEDFSESVDPIYTPAKSDSSTAGRTLPDEVSDIEGHANMKREIEKKKCLPGIRSPDDFKAAAQRGFQAASRFVAHLDRPFREWSVDDLAKIHGLYFGELYPHGGKFRAPSDLATVGGRVAADGKHIPAELDLLLEQCGHLQNALPPAGTPEGLTQRLKLIAFTHARLVLIHPFTDGNGRWARLVTSSLERQLLPATGSRSSVPKAIYIHALNQLPANLGPLMDYHGQRYGLRPSTIKPIKPPFPVQVTHRG